MLFGEISGFAARKSSIETPNFRAMLLMVSPALMVYVKGVRLGSGVSAAIRGSGVWLGFWVDVKKGIRVEGIGVVEAPGEEHEARTKMKDERRMRMAEH